MSHNNYSVHAPVSPKNNVLSVVLAAEVLQPQTGLANTKNKPFIDCLIGRSLLDVGRQAVKMHVLYDYRVEVACLFEVRLPVEAKISSKFLVRTVLAGLSTVAL